MLLQIETEGAIRELIQALYSAWTVSMIGKELGSSIIGTPRNISAGDLALLEWAYVAGTAADLLGPTTANTLSRQDLLLWTRNHNPTLTYRDTEILASLKRETEIWIQGRTDVQQGRIRKILIKAERQWRALEQGGRATAELRNQALDELLQDIKDATDAATGEIDRITQSELQHYYQQGQTAHLSDETLVYKQPRAEACERCLTLHLNEDGSPKTYTLGQLRATSNLDTPTYAWGATVGPTHPYCYCQLRVVTDNAELPPNEELAQRRQERQEELKKSLPGQTLLFIRNSNDPLERSKRTLIKALLKTTREE